MKRRRKRIVQLTVPQIALIGHVGARLPRELQEPFVRAVVAGMRDQEPSLFGAHVVNSWRRTVRDAGLL